MANRAKKLSGINPLSYLGVEPSSPPQLIFEERAPTTDDRVGNLIGALWIQGQTDTAAARIWLLVRLQAGNASWLELQTGAGGETYVTDNGSVVPVANVVNLTGGTSVGGAATNINTFADPAGSNNLRVALNNSISQPDTNAAGTTGLYSLGGNDFMHNFGTRNTFLGSDAGNRTLTGTDNTSGGFNAGNGITSGIENTLIGGYAGLAVDAQNNVTAIGHEAMRNAVGGNNNIAIGSEAMMDIVNGAFDNIVIGDNGAQNLDGGDNNVMIGHNVANAGTTCNNNTIVGKDAVSVGVLTGDNNVIAGFSAAANATSAFNNVIIGSGASSNGVITGSLNVIIGDDSGKEITSGIQNTLVGRQSGKSITLANNCTYIGGQSGRDTVSSINNVGVGVSSLQDCIVGGSNVALGTDALMTYIGATSDDDNIAIGHRTLQTVTQCTNNVGIGSRSLRLNSSGSTDGRGSFNIGLGVETLNKLNPTAIGESRDNIAIGYQAGFNILTGSNNFFAGTLAASSLVAAESSNIIISSPGVVGDNNTIRIGTSGAGAGQQNKCFVAGIRGITTGVADAVAVLIDSAGQLGTVSSSLRYKKEVRDMGVDSNPIMHLRPVTFKYKDDRSSRIQYGLIAEEVDRTMPNLVIYNDKGAPETIRYHEMPVLLLSELQKMERRITKLEHKLSSCRCHCSSR